MSNRKEKSRGGNRAEELERGLNINLHPRSLKTRVEKQLGGLATMTCPLALLHRTVDLLLDMLLFTNSHDMVSESLTNFVKSSSPEINTLVYA